MKIKSTILLVLAAVILPLASQAEPKNGKEKGPRPEAGERFQAMDADSSGTISEEEAKGPLAEHFSEIDADGDGELTKDELKAAREARGGKGKGKNKIKEADTDGNEAISADEAEAAGLEKLIENFSTLDADGNGEITKEEFKAAREARGDRGSKAE